MKVKIRDRLYDSAEELIAVQLTPQERLEIQHMPPANDLYMSGPLGTPQKDFQDFSASLRVPVAAPAPRPGMAVIDGGKK